MKRLLLGVAVFCLANSLAAQNVQPPVQYTSWMDQNISVQQNGVVDQNPILIDATNLSEGYHVVNVRFGTDSLSVLRNFLFYKPIAEKTFSPTLSYSCWFDQDISTLQTGSVQDGILINTDSLTEGYHVVNIRIGEGEESSLQNFFFYKPLPEQEYLAALNYTCWFDQDISARQTGSLQGGILINTDSLTEGYHVVNIRIGEGEASSLQNFIFYKPIDQYMSALDTSQSTLVYLFDGETTPHQISPALGIHLIDPPDMECGEQGYIHTMLKVGGQYVTPINSHRFVMMDSVCCIAPMYVTVDSITETGARIHWTYNRAEVFSIAIDTIPFTPGNITPTLALTDTVFRFTDLHSAKDYYYAVKTDCDTQPNSWVMGTWTTICRTLNQTSAVACDRYQWRGHEYTQGGVYRDTVVSVNGYEEACDSIYELQLTLHHSDSTVFDVTACRSYSWHDSTYTASTDSAHFETTTQYGCDSLVTLHLTVNHSTYPDSTVYDTACDHHSWHGQTYYTTGEYLYTHHYSDSPCPSIDTLKLKVYPKYDIHHYVSIFDGDSTWFGGNWHATAGVYQDSLVSVHGCDSLRTLHVSIKPVDVRMEQGSICQGVAYNGSHFQLSENITAISSGLLTLRDTLRSRGFDSIIYGLDLTVISSQLSTPTGLVPAADSVIAHGTIVLSWNSVQNATGYRVYLWKSEHPEPTTPTFLTTQPYKVVTDYENFNTYNWRVEALNPCDTQGSDLQQFVINKQPILTLESHALAFGEVNYNDTVQQTLRMAGRDLTDTIHLSLHGTDSALFALSDLMVSRYGGSVEVSFSPSVLKRSFDAYVVVQSGTLRDTVTLNGLLSNYYVFNVNVPDSILPPATPVPITGTLTNATGTAEPSVAVDIWVRVMGRTIIVTDTTDAQGHFGMTYTPVTSECGYYEAGACIHNSGNHPTMTTFNIPGISFTGDTWPVWEVVQNDTLTGSIPVKNRCSVPLHNIAIHADSLPSGVILYFDTLTLSPFASDSLNFTLVCGIPSSGSEYENIRLSTSCTEGLLGGVLAYYYCFKPVADLQISFDSLICAAVPGEQKVVDIALYNNTDSTFRDVRLNLPQELAGMGLLHVDTLYNIPPHDSLFIPLLLNFPEGTLLAPITGQMVVSASNASPQFLPFTVNVVSNATGSLRVLVSNEYTYYNNGPHVSGATVTVIGYYSLDTVATGVTGSNGQIVFDSLPEGYYNLYVSAPENDDHETVIQISSGQQTIEDVDLSFQAITYSWDVRQTSLEDSWSVSLKTEYKTNVPKPVIELSIPYFDVPFDGSLGMFEITITNHGLINGYDAELILPESDVYEFIPLFDRIDTIKALTSIRVPCGVRNKIIYDTVQSLISQGKYAADTVYDVRSVMLAYTVTKDTIIFEPICPLEESTDDNIKKEGSEEKTSLDSSWLYDTIYVTLSHIEVDTIYDSIVKHIAYYDTTTLDTVVKLSQYLETVWGNCETMPFRLVAHYKCNNEGKFVETIYTVEPIDCPVPKEEVPQKIKKTKEKIIRDPYPGGGELNPLPGPYPKPGPHPNPSPKPKRKWPSFELPKFEPQIFTDWECQPCWYTAVKGSLDCVGNILIAVGTYGMGDKIIALTKASQMEGQAGRHATSSMLLDAAIKQNINFERFGNVTGGIDKYSITSDIARLQIGEAVYDGLTMALGEISPGGSAIMSCGKDIKDIIDGCNNGIGIEVPWNFVRERKDTTVYMRNMLMAVAYYDTLQSIRYRVVTEDIPVFESHPEVLVDLVGYFVSADSAMVEEAAQSYDTMVTTIDTIVLRRCVERWNRTRDYLNRGWFKPSLVPDGYSLDFVTIDSSITSALVNMEAVAFDEGYGSIDELFFASLDSLLSYPQKRSVCAGVSLQFQQDVAMTREAFEGVLSISNPHDTAALRNLALSFSVTDTTGHDCSDKFDISILRQEGVGADSSIAPGSTATVTVSFVPLISAAPTDSTPYLFGGTVDYTNPYTHLDVADDLRPVQLTVSPSPHLRLDYFVPHDIIADDPLTAPMIEPAVPATVGIRVINDGVGLARNVRLSALSLQITENRQGLAVDFSMLNTMRNGEEFSLPLGDISLGAINPQNIQTLEYSFVSSFLGTMSVQDVHVIHNSSVDDRDMNLVDVYSHRLVHPVLEYKTGSDSIHDFLTDDIANGPDRPDSLFFSTGRATSVQMVDSTTYNHYVEGTDTVVQVTLYPDTVGWNYGTTADPGRGKYEIVSCVRDDNTIIPLDNIWLTFVDLQEGQDPFYVDKLHLTDTLYEVRPTVYNVTFRRLPDLLMVDTITHLPLMDTYIPVDSFVVVFNKPIIDSTFTYSDLSLKCNNGGELMDSTVTVTRLNDTTFSIDISRKTYGFGLYVLKVMADSIVDATGHYGHGGKEVQWVRTECTPFVVNESRSVCDSLRWNDTLRTSSGVYFDTLPGLYGCDTIIALHLTVNHPSYDDTSVTACNSFTWYDSIYTEGGDYVRTWTSALPGGCDSIVTLHLTLFYSFPLDIAANTWHAISSPMHNTAQGEETVDGITGLVGDGFAYDLYYYGEGDATWFNYKADSFALQPAHGYIYRRSEATTLYFNGQPNGGGDDGITVPLSASSDNNSLRGFNLIGNPYPHAVSYNAPYYELRPTGSWYAHPAGVIEAAQGFLVHTETATTYTFADMLPSKGTMVSTPILTFTVAGRGHEDVAYAMFGDGTSLPKIAHLNADVPELSINGQAIAILDEATSEFPLSLRARPGDYTLTAHLSSPFPYIHLIDKVTGFDRDLLEDSTYSFTQSGSPTAADRFLVRLAPALPEEEGDIFAHIDGKTLVIEGEGPLRVYDMLGRLVLTREVASTLRIPLSDFHPGVYALQLGDKRQRIVIE